MAELRPHYGREKHAALGEAIYERDIRGSIEPNSLGKYVAIDINTGVYEVDSSELAGSGRLLARVPDAQVWLRRVGSRYARRFGSRPRPEYDDCPWTAEELQAVAWEVGERSGWEGMDEPAGPS